MSIKQITIPQDFMLGAAASAWQTEGWSGKKPGQDSWIDLWYKNDRHVWHNGYGPAVATDFINRFREDVALMKQAGLTHYRTSINWSRFLTDYENATVDEEYAAYYYALFDEMHRQGIEPMICLEHYELPGVLLETYGGWASKHVVELFVRYAEKVFERFHGKVTRWFTFNEPIVPVEGGYLYDFHYPNVVDFRRAATVAYHTVLAHAKAVQAYRAGHYAGEIGIVLNLTPSYPRSQNPADVKAAHVADLMFNRSFLDPVLRGEYPADLVALLKSYDQLPACKPEDGFLIAEGKIDLLGINYYQPRRVKCRDSAVNPQAPFMPEWFFDSYEMPGRKMNPYRGWEIYAPGIYDILINLRDNYGNPRCFISENGMGVENEQRFIENGQINDQYRIEFISEHLAWLHKGISEGCNCLGYHMWTFIDNWSWCNAYKNRYGFIQLDLKTQQRTIKKSGEWFAATALNNSFDKE